MKDVSYLLGGDVKSPALRRFLFRAAIAVVLLIGLTVFFRGPYQGEYEAALMFAARALFAAFIAYEGWRSYRKSDELFRKLTGESLALSSIIILSGAFIYHAAVFYLGLPEPTLRQLLLAICFTILFSWIFVAKRTM